MLCRAPEALQTCEHNAGREGNPQHADRCAAAIREITEASQSLCRDEAYELVVAAEGVSISAERPAGVFCGIQSLLQLLPWTNDVPDSSPVLKGCRIVDYPRFRWYELVLAQERNGVSCAPQ